MPRRRRPYDKGDVSHCFPVSTPPPPQKADFRPFSWRFELLVRVVMIGWVELIAATHGAG